MKMLMLGAAAHCAAIYIRLAVFETPVTEEDILISGFCYVLAAWLFKNND